MIRPCCVCSSQLSRSFTSRPVAELLARAILVVALLALPAGAAAEGWKLRADQKDAISDYLATSRAVDDLNTYARGNMTVYASTDRETTLISVYDFFACAHLSNPNSHMTIDTGGGVDVTVDEANFARGKWDADVRLAQHTAINELDQTAYLVPTQVRVGRLSFTTKDKMAEAIRWLVAGCLVEPPKDWKAPESNGG